MKKLISLIVALAAVTAFAVPALGAPKTIRVVDNKFRPASTSVKRGNTVKFVWAGKAPHNVTVVKGPVKFRSPTKTKGTYSKKLRRRGTYSIVCTIHSGMTLKLKVR
jgi:plastocyanin